MLWPFCLPEHFGHKRIRCGCVIVLSLPMALPLHSPTKVTFLQYPYPVARLRKSLPIQLLIRHRFGVLIVSRLLLLPTAWEVWTYLLCRKTLLLMPDIFYLLPISCLLPKMPDSLQTDNFSRYIRFRFRADVL